MLVWTHAEMFYRLSGVLWSSEEKGVASGWSSQGQLIQGQDLTTGCNDASTSGGSEAESRNAELWDGQETVVIGYSTNDDNGLVVRLLGSVGGNSRDGNWRSVDAGHKKSAEDNLVEGGVGSACSQIIRSESEGGDRIPWWMLYLRAKKR